MPEPRNARQTHPQGESAWELIIAVAIVGAILGAIFED